jgi:predicted Fe-Mo cluster-binding NifX family protein
MELAEVKQFLQLSNQQSFCKTSPHASHPLDGIQVFIARNFGWGLMRHLQRRGIHPMATTKTDPNAAVWEYLNRAREGTLQNNCSFAKNGHQGTRCQRRRRRGAQVGSLLREAKE